MSMRKSDRVGNSFSVGEIQVLDFIFQTLLRGGTPNTVCRNKDFASLYRKVMAMKKRQSGTESRSVVTVED